MSRDTEEHGTTATCVANFQGWMRAVPVVADGSRVFLDQALYSFDLSEYGLVGAFSTSGCLYAVTAEQSLDFRALFESLADSGIEVWVSTPSFEDLCLADPSFFLLLVPTIAGAAALVALELASSGMRPRVWDEAQRLRQLLSRAGPHHTRVLHAACGSRRRQARPGR
ncbi:hypothetical protein [uncultured Parolsenella sp.]|uniref:hypothetical protein n=1 Tax=uncultured Parolsenella sp. TaxID=2083008 RepID=UPI0027DCEFB1|nr:hypothetical protein [uncultured Parolsenella sp.]